MTSDPATGEVILVAALDRNGAIGVRGGLPWHLPDDFRRFKERTLDGVVVMGRRTAESLPFVLPRRRNLVLTRSGVLPYPGMEAVSTLDEARALAGMAPLLVIGGGEVYALALPQASQLWLTIVDVEVPEADAWFPEIDLVEWEVGVKAPRPVDDRHSVAFEFVDYRRRRP